VSSHHHMDDRRNRVIDSESSKQTNCGDFS